MLVPGIRSPCHQLCAMSGSVLISAMCTNGISSELLNAHSLSAPRTCNTRLPSEMDKSTTLLLLCYWGVIQVITGICPDPARFKRGLREPAREVEESANGQKKRKAV